MTEEASINAKGTITDSWLNMRVAVLHGGRVVFWAGEVGGIGVRGSSNFSFFKKLSTSSMNFASLHNGVKHR
jgi:hypothetical protein